MGVAPAPKIVLHFFDPRLPCPKPNVVFILGGPGSGKGTMCELAEIQLGWVHLSAGEILRKEREKGGPLATIIEENIAAGKLVPFDTIVNLLKREMEKSTRMTGKKNFLIDGFPRSINNLEGWIEIMGPELDLPKMLYLECDYAVLEKRIMGRAKYTGRSDDNLKSVKLRFDTFKAETIPTVEYFKKLDKCVEVDASLKREEVYNILKNHLTEHTDAVLASNPYTEKAEILLGLRPYPKK
jgi:adenylate kinase family enzyme